VLSFPRKRLLVIPAQAGIQGSIKVVVWMPALAGMTESGRS